MSNRCELPIDGVLGAGLMFHHFHGDDHPMGQGSINAEEFAKLIEFVGRKQIINAREWLERAAAGTLQAGDLCITFDDGLACQYEVALPVLDAYDIEAFWFIYTSPLEGVVQRLEVYRYLRSVAFPSVEIFYENFHACLAKSPYSDLVRDSISYFFNESYLSEFPFYTKKDREFRYIRDEVLGPQKYFEVMDEMVMAAGYDPVSLSSKLFCTADNIRKLDSNGHVVGLHSHTHPTKLRALDVSAQKSEFYKNKEILESLISKPVRAMSHPCNSYGDDTLKVLGELGVNVGFRSNMTYIESRGKYEYPREDHANLMRAIR
ncbi:MAG: polysaccharide deacetylase family protein [Gammaproteobacteria bacterium]|nr:polysaccharide deacetylase family protein [Gammaproteobacteria bacterium]MBU0801606.1 polysaccharide deacetylase family protein [Alphaproteobacteria bacterium]MBU1804124.1 polysaccharide deacetylase family protein [Gammaproteobacteria bacterium]